jgi:hypothetical protein
MKFLTILCTAALVVPIVAATTRPATKIRFAPADGSSATKTFESKSTLTLDEFTMTGPGGSQSPEMEQTLSSNQKVVITDEYTKSKDGLPQKLARNFDELSGDMAMTMKMEFMGQSQSSEQNMRTKSELEGKKVVFTWDEQKGEHAKAFDPAADEKAELLAGLREDMDLRGFLPKDEVKDGDEWDVEGKKLLDVFTPGGNLLLVPENSDAKSLQLAVEMTTMMATIGDKLEGGAKCKLTAVKEIDGAQCALIHLDVKVHSKASMVDAARKMIERSDLPPEVRGIEFEKLDVEFAFEGQGDLVWDLAAGHFRSLDLSGETTLTTEQTMKVPGPSGKITIERKSGMSGQSSYAAKAK